MKFTGGLLTAAVVLVLLMNVLPASSQVDKRRDT